MRQSAINCLIFNSKPQTLRHYHVKSYPEFCVKIVRGFACTPARQDRSQLGAKMFDGLDFNTVAPRSPCPNPHGRQSAAEIRRLSIRKNPIIAEIGGQSDAEDFAKLTQLCQHRRGWP